MTPLLSGFMDELEKNAGLVRDLGRSIRQIFNDSERLMNIRVKKAVANKTKRIRNDALRRANGLGMFSETYKKAYRRTLRLPDVGDRLIRMKSAKYKNIDRAIGAATIGVPVAAGTAAAIHLHKLMELKQ